MKWNGGKGFSYTAVSTLVNVLVRSLGWGRADPPQSCSVDISGRSGSGSHGQGVSQRWRHTLVFSGSRRDNTTDDTEDSTPHPGANPVWSPDMLWRSSAPVYIITDGMQVLRPQPQGPQWDRGAEHWGASRSCLSSVLAGLGVLSVHPQGGDPEVHEFLQTLNCAQEKAGQATGQVSCAGKTSISAEISTLSTKLMLSLITMKKPPIEILEDI